jgi:hypothetical protein
VGIFKWLSNRSARSRPYVRWSSEELAEKKRYLETRSPDEYVRDDYQLLIEWLFQRYLPPDDVMTEESWSRTINKLMAKVDLNIERQKTEPYRPWAPPPRPPKYELTRDDFDTIIVPCLMRFSFFPEVSTLDWHGGQFGEAYWLIASKVYKDQSEGRTRISGMCDDFAISRVIWEHRHAFEALMNAQRAGLTRVSVSADPKQCPACRSKAPYIEDTAVLLDAFRDGCPPFPHEVLREETNDWCRSPIIVGTSDMATQDDIEFHERVVKGIGNPLNLARYIKTFTAGRDR